jgi:hypothetical protein
MAADVPMATKRELLTAKASARHSRVHGVHLRVRHDQIRIDRERGNVRA